MNKISYGVIGLNVGIIGLNLYNFMFRTGGILSLALITIPVGGIASMVYMDRKPDYSTRLSKMKALFGLEAPPCLSCGSTKTRFDFSSTNDCYTCGGCNGHTQSWFRFVKGRVTEKME